MNLSPLPVQKFFDNNGNPLVGGKLFTYVAGTSTKLATYTDSTGGASNTNPIVLDFRGEARVWIDPALSYKFVLAPATDTDPPTKAIWSVDNITAGPVNQDNAAVDTGSVNAIALAIPQISSPVAFTRIVFKAAVTNTGATTITINGGTAKALKYQNTAAFSGGEILAGGIYEAVFDGTQWQLQGPAVAYWRTAAEVSASVVPTNYNIPSHLVIGVVLPERYGGAGDNSTLNDTPHANSMKVAYQIGNGTVVYGAYSSGIWKFAAPVTVGAASQGTRVIALGRVEWNFSASIGSTLDLVTISADLNSAYRDQPQFDDIQVNCNRGGRDGIVLTVGNRPLIRNFRVINAARDGYVESVTGTNWIEKADVSGTVLSAGRNGVRQEILGTAGQNPYINEGRYWLEVRGVSAVTAGGKALAWTGSAGLGAAAKISGNQYHTVFDAIYNAAAAVPATSPVVSDTVLVDNALFIRPSWENTGTGGNPGAGPLVKVNSGTVAYLTFISPDWNSFWGDGTLDAAIVGVNRIADRSFPANNTQYGKLSLKGNVDNQTILDLKGQTTAGTAADLAVTRTASAVNAIGQGSCIILGNSTTSTFAAVQEYNGELVTYTFSGGSWAERCRVLPAGGIRIFGFSAVYSGTGAPGAGLGANGDYYFRQDTPGTANQRMYVKNAGAWAGVV